MIRHSYERSVITPGRCGASELVSGTHGHFRCCGKPESAETHNPLKLRHPELKSLSEAQSEIEDPQCGCGAYLDDDDREIGACKDCVNAARRAARRDYEREYGVVDERDQFAGRGMPK